MPRHKDKMIRNSSGKRTAFTIIFVSAAIIWLSAGCITVNEPSAANPEAGNTALPADYSTVFEVYTGNFRATAGSPYEMLLVRGDGFIYYETGTRNHLGPASNFTMRQGQLPLEEVAKLQSLIEACPQETYSKFGSDQPAFSGPYAFVFSPTRAIWAYEQTGGQITTNFDPFSQNLTNFPDISGEAAALWAELTSVVKDTVPPDVPPDLWPGQYFDGRNYDVRPEPSVKM